MNAAVASHPGIAAWLQCLACARPGLSERADGYRCGSCGASYPILRDVARFVDAERYAGSFGYQWNRFARTQLDSANGDDRSRRTFVQKTGWRLEDLAGARVLDAGCGMGRFAEVCADAGADVHAADLSVAVEAASANLGHRDNVRIYQADIMRLPFAAGTFDFIYSLGVLHHTPDTHAAFKALCPLLKPGGRLAIWVYSTSLKAWGSEVLRPLTSRLPKPWLLAATRIAVPLYHVHRLRFIGILTSIALPTSVDPDPAWRWLDTFDWYSPRYQHKHSWREVEGWFTDAGFEEVRRQPFEVAVSGRRPLDGSASAGGANRRAG